MIFNIFVCLKTVCMYVEVSCGQHHCIALLTITKAKGNLSVVYAWGEESRGQLGSG